MDARIADTEWIYDIVCKYTEEEKEEVRRGLLKDKKRKFRWSQIEMGGNDTAQGNEAMVK